MTWQHFFERHLLVQLFHGNGAQLMKTPLIHVGLVNYLVLPPFFKYIGYSAPSTRVSVPFQRVCFAAPLQSLAQSPLVAVAPRGSLLLPLMSGYLSIFLAFSSMIGGLKSSRKKLELLAPPGAITLLLLLMLIRLLSACNCKVQQHQRVISRLGAF
jgi:hypothetical protein